MTGTPKDNPWQSLPSLTGYGIFLREDARAMAEDEKASRRLESGKSVFAASQLYQITRAELLAVDRKQGNWLSDPKGVMILSVTTNGSSADQANVYLLSLLTGLQRRLDIPENEMSVQSTTFGPNQTPAIQLAITADAYQKMEAALLDDPALRTLAEKHLRGENTFIPHKALASISDMIKSRLGGNHFNTTMKALTTDMGFMFFNNQKANRSSADMAQDALVKMQEIFKEVGLDPAQIRLDKENDFSTLKIHFHNDVDPKTLDAVVDAMRNLPEKQSAIKSNMQFADASQTESLGSPARILTSEKTGASPIVGT